MCGCLLYQPLNFKWKIPVYLQKAREAKKKSETEILLLSNSCVGQLNLYRQAPTTAAHHMALHSSVNSRARRDYCFTCYVPAYVKFSLHNSPKRHHE